MQPVAAAVSPGLAVPTPLPAAAQHLGLPQPGRCSHMCGMHAEAKPAHVCKQHASLMQRRCCIYMSLLPALMHPSGAAQSAPIPQAGICHACMRSCRVWMAGNTDTAGQGASAVQLMRPTCGLRTLRLARQLLAEMDSSVATCVCIDFAPSPQGHASCTGSRERRSSAARAGGGQASVLLHIAKMRSRLQQASWPVCCGSTSGRRCCRSPWAGHRHLRPVDSIWAPSLSMWDPAHWCIHVES